LDLSGHRWHGSISIRAEQLALAETNREKSIGAAGATSTAVISISAKEIRPIIDGFLARLTLAVETRFMPLRR